MSDTPASIEEKTRKLQAAYDEFMSQMRALERDKLEVMKRVLGEAEREEIGRLIDELKKDV
jgi:hypothetical protein